MKKVSPRLYFFRKMLHYFGVGMLVVLLLFLWSLYRGPISVPYLKPYIVQALNYSENEYSIDIGDVNIELVRSIQPIRVTARDISLQKKDDTLTIAAPKLYMSFSLRALLKGIIAPSDISLHNPSLYIYARYGLEEEHKNEINRKKLRYYVEKLQEFLNNYNSPDKIYPESYVNNINIINGDVEFDEVELGRKWLLTDLNFEFSRNLINMQMNANALININDKIASAGFESEYHAGSDKLDLEVFFSDLVLSDIIGTFNETTEDNMLSMMSIELPVNGKISTSIDLADILQNPDEAADYVSAAIEKINFELDGGHGYIAFNDDEKYNYAIDELLLSGEVSGGIDEIKIDHAELNLGGQKAQISFNISGFETYLWEHSLRDMSMQLTAKVGEFPLVELSRFWPRYVAEPAWQWCKDGLIGGTAKNAEFTFDFGYDRRKDLWGLQKLNGKAYLQDGDIFYLEGMPVVHKVYGTAFFSSSAITINIDKGISDGIMITGGKVDIYDLNRDRNYLALDLVGNTTVPEALAFINHPPLHLADEMGLNPQDIKGNVDVKYKMKFELKQDLGTDELNVKVAADLANVSSSKLVENHTVTAKKMKLKVDGKGWNLAGKAEFDDIPVDLQIDEKFAAKDYSSKCNISLVLDDKVKQALGIDWSILRAPYIEGYVPVSADVIVRKDKSLEIAVKADLQNVKIDYAFLGFMKAAHQPAEAKAKILLHNKKVSAVPNMSLSKAGFVIGGYMTMYPSGRVKTIDITKFTGPKTSAQAKIALSDKENTDIKVNVSGSSFDLTPLFDKSDNKKQEKSIPVQENEDDGLEKVPNTDISILVNSLWTNDTTPIQNFSGSAKLRTGIGMEELHMAGNYGRDKSIKVNVDYTPRDNKEHYLSIVSNNAGSTLKVLRLYENMVGGTLKIEARRDVAKKFIGHATVRDFSIQNAPVMAQLLSVASLTGMLDLLKGDGLTFTHFNAPFEYHYKILQLNHAKAEGNVVGITTSGQYNRATDALNLYGGIAPAYSLNRFLGTIPVVGNLLASKDGTIFAADYKINGSVDKPDVDINSLSILSPNSVKEWYRQNFGESYDN